MRPIARRMSMSVLGVLAALAVFLPASGASAATTTLAGDWAPFTRCPVDNSAMLAADGTSNIAFCVASNSPSGSIKLGKITAPMGDSNLQIGVIENANTGAFSVVTSAGGAIVNAPIQIPGGLLGLICPSSVPVVSAVCNEITNSTLNAVTAVVQPAGNPSNFSLDAGLSSGIPIINLPVKIQLQNPLLGSNCYIGSNSNPIVLNPENVTTPNVNFEEFDGNGTPDPNGVMDAIYSLGGTQEDNSAAAPAASGCGLLGVLDLAVDLKVGLPSASGNNILVLNNAAAYLAGFATAVPNEGQQLSANWHSAVQS
jgi:hypothetical protein